MTDYLTQKTHDYVVANLRAFPVTVGLYSMVAGLLFNNPTYLFFGVYVFICDGCSSILKSIFRVIYKAVKHDTIPILGRGLRPVGAKYCGAFITEHNLDGKSLAIDGKTPSFGMPSGHAIVAGATFTFWMNYINEHTDDKKLKRRQIVLLGLICTAVILSRVYLGCHTMQQALIGAVVGAALGYVGHRYLYKQVLYYIEYYNILKMF